MTALTETIVAAVDHDPTNPEFELLHPRGRDGQWIKKGGHIKIHPKMGGEPLLGVVDDVASDGTINITLNDGRKVNAKPDQIEQIHSVARLDAPAPPTPNVTLPPGVVRGGLDKDGYRLPDSDGIIRLGGNDQAKIGAKSSDHVPEAALPAPAPTPAPAAPAANAPEQAGSVDDLNKIAAESGGIVLMHGGLPEGTRLQDIDLDRSGSQQNKKGRTYGGFYLTDESSRKWSDKYAADRNGQVNGFLLRPDAKIDDRTDRADGHTDRLSQEQRDEARAAGFDVIKGRDSLGRMQYVLLNPGAVSHESQENINEPKATLDSPSSPETPGVSTSVIPDALAGAAWADFESGSVPGFTVEKNEQRGINPSLWVTDDSNGKRYLVKKGGFNDWDGPEASNTAYGYEQQALEIFNKIGMSNSPAVRASDDSQFIIVQDVRDIHGTADPMTFDEEHVRSKRFSALDAEKFLEKFPMADEEDFIRMNAADMIMGNFDRNNGNWMISRREDGLHELHPIDHGLINSEKTYDEWWPWNSAYASSQIAQYLRKVNGDQRYKEVLNDAFNSAGVAPEWQEREDLLNKIIESMDKQRPYQWDSWKERDSKGFLGRFKREKNVEPGGDVLAEPDQATPEASSKAPDAVPPFNDPLPSSDTERGKDEIYPQLMADLDAYDAERPGNRHEGEDRRSVWNRMWGNGYVRNKLRTHYLNEAPPAPKAAPFDPFSPIPNANHEQVEARHPGVDAPIYVDAEMKDLLEALWQFNGTMDTHQSDGGNENRPAMVQFRTVEGAEKFLELIGHDKDVVDLPKIFNPYIGSDDLDVTPEQWDAIVKDKRYVIDKSITNGAIVNIPVDDLADVTAKLKAHLTAPEPAVSYPDPWGNPDAPFDRNSDQIHKNAIVRVHADDGSNKVVEGRVAQINGMGKGHAPVLEVDPLNGGRRITARPDQIEHVDDAIPVQGFTEDPNQGPVPRGIPENLTMIRWDQIVSGSSSSHGFDTEPNQSSGANASYWVQDRATGAQFLVKNSQDADGYADPAAMNENEVFGAELLNHMGFEGVSPVAISTDDPYLVYMQDAGEANGTKLIGTAGSYLYGDNSGIDFENAEPEEILNSLNLKNPEDVIRMTIMDAAIGNSDRHEENWMLGELPDGTRIIHPIDHGLLEPLTYGGPQWFSEFDHQASTRLTRHLLDVLGDEKMLELIRSVLKARDEKVGSAPRHLKAGIRRERGKTLEDEALEYLEALRQV